MPDRECALIQLYRLVLYPHLIHAAYGRTLDRELIEELITGGIDMFLSHDRYVPTAR
jgi:TetR/AcrR family transcriptional regulator, mexJK operon transcriptional repressor